MGLQRMARSEVIKLAVISQTMIGEAESWRSTIFWSVMRILIGTLAALVIAGLVAGVAQIWAGPLLFVLLSVTLALSLRREIEP